MARGYDSKNREIQCRNSLEVFRCKNKEVE